MYQLIPICRYAVFQIKDLISILVNLILWRCSQTDKRCIEVIENILVFVVDRAVCLIADHKIKMTAGENLAIFIFGFVDEINHGLIGREDAVRTVIVFLFCDIAAGKVRKEIYKVPFCLHHKRSSVRKKENVADPSGIHQHLTECDDGSCLARSGRHNKQRLSAILVIKAVADRFNRGFLIISPCNLLIYYHIS